MPDPSWDALIGVSEVCLALADERNRDAAPYVVKDQQPISSQAMCNLAMLLEERINSTTWYEDRQKSPLTGKQRKQLNDIHDALALFHKRVVAADETVADMIGLDYGFVGDNGIGIQKLYALLMTVESVVDEVSESVSSGKPPNPYNIWGDQIIDALINLYEEVTGEPSKRKTVGKYGHGDINSFVDKCLPHLDIVLTESAIDGRIKKLLKAA